MTGLRACGLGVDVGDRVLLEDLDFDLPPGQVTLLAGRNGSGKTTLLTVLAGLRSPRAGRVELDGRDIDGIPPRARARCITLIPQESDCPFEFTGRELVMMGRHPHISRFGSPGPSDHAAVEQALELADAGAFSDRPVTTLSGGERRRIAIARALATEAEILLADEPTANLDLDHGLATLALFRRLCEQGRTVLIVSHDLNLIAPAVDRAALLHRGRVRSVGTPRDVFSGELMEEVFRVRSGEPSGFFPRAWSAL